MRRSSLVAVALAVSVAAAAQGPPAGRSIGNLIGNGGFEKPGAENMPTAWFAKITSAPEGMVEVSRARDGYRSDWCLRLSSQATKVLYGAYCQPVDIPDGATELLVSFYYKTRDIPQPDVYVLVFNRDFAEREWQTPYIQAEDHPIPQSRDWSVMGWRFRLIPGAKQALVAFRAAGRGVLQVDDVSLRVYGDPVRCQLLDVGRITGLPSRRALRFNLETTPGFRGKLAASLVVSEKGRPKTLWRQTLKPSASGTVTATYSYDYSKSAAGTFLLASADTGEVYDIQRVEVPALLTGRITRPAFRGTLLKSLPSPTIEAEGEINATAQLARGAKVTAELAGASRLAAELRELRRPSELTWHATFVPKDLLTGKYDLVVSCQISGRNFQLRLPLTVAPPQDAEVAYDERGVLWVAGRRMLPRGIYFATRESEVVEAKAAGYNFTIIPASLASMAVMDKAAEVGLYVIVHSRSMEYEEHSAWEHITGKYGSHPALLAWHIVPKPDAELTPPFELQGLRRAVATYDPHHPVVTSLTMPSLMRDYSGVCDLALVWTDPIPESGVRAVGVLLDEARRALAPKPIWAVIQTIGHHWSWDRNLDPSGDGRPPTPQEHRCMTYLALVHGATGLVNYTYVFEGRRRGANFRLDRDAPALWTSTIRTNRQLAWIEPIITRGSWHPIELSPSASVHIAYWKSRDRLVVIAVNTTARSTAAAFRIPPVASALLTEVFTGEKVIGSPAGDFGVQLEPYGVAVLLGRLAPQ